MPDFFQKLRKNMLARVIAAYLMVGWIVMQIGEIMVPALKLPDWINSALAFVLILGFPVAILLGWIYQRATTEKAPETGTESGQFRFEYLLLGGLVLVAGMTVFRLQGPADMPIQEDVQELELAEAAQTAASGPASPQQVATDRGNSVAVLPFRDLSFDASQAYFANGTTEELLYALSKLEGLEVAGRVSTLAASREEDSIRSIGTRLNVSYALEGSVRKQGEQIRISVQLTDTRNGYAVWSERYDRPLGDIFDIQEDIARSVVQELDLVLESGKTRLVTSEMRNSEAYAVFLQGRTLFLKTYNDPPESAIALLQEAVQLDPEFARAWATLAEAMSLAPSYIDKDLRAIWADAEKYAMRALALDPDLAEAYAVLGQIAAERKEYSALQAHFDRALALSPKDITVLNFYAVAMVNVGHLKTARQTYQKMVEIDPISELGLAGLAYTSFVAGNIDEAEQWSQKALEFGYPAGLLLQGEIAGYRGEKDKAVQIVSSTFQLGGFVRGLGMKETTGLVRGMYGSDQDRLDALDILKDYLATEGSSHDNLASSFLLRFHEYDRAFAMFESTDTAFSVIFYGNLWGQPGKEARQHPAFKAYAQNTGLVEYWRTHGWPDMCQPAGDSFECG